ncbi:MAG: NUDIX hydrolase [Patescibacteria group bacterium]|nr:NUDIX hydrolase [Patescibacteria group bacterium]
MFEFKTDVRIFHDERGQPHEKPDDVPILWRPSGYAFIPTGDTILMVEPACSPGVWMLPGGGIEPHEPYLDGVRRECREELGLEVSIEPQAPLYFGEHDFYFKWTDQYLHSLVLMFFGRAPASSFGNELPTPDPGEILHIKWLKLGELTELNCHFVAWPLIRRLKG